MSYQPATETEGFYRFTAKLWWGCCGNEILGTGGCVVKEEENRSVYSKKKKLNCAAPSWDCVGMKTERR